ncbi:MAG: LysM repeat protein, partial [Paracoccaceae bacterium]
MSIMTRNSLPHLVPRFAPRFAPRPALYRLFASVAAVALVAACSEPLGFDMRGQVGGFSTTNAVQSINSDRPKPDDRGIISYPNYQVAVARRGDTAASVAARIGLPATELARFNGMKPEDPLRDGEILALPRRVAEPAAAAGAVDIEALAGDAINSAPDTTPVQTTALKPSTPTPAPKPKPEAKPEPLRHKVKRGETAYTISRLYQVSVKSLAEWNGLGSDFAIREGQYLLIPVTGVAPPKGSAAAIPTVVTQPGAGSPTPTPPSATTPLPAEKIDPKPPVAPKVSVGQPSNAASGGQFAFPV